jgi:hypothetical protein
VYVCLYILFLLCSQTSLCCLWSVLCRLRFEHWFGHWTIGFLRKQRGWQLEPLLRPLEGISRWWFH